MAESRHRKLVVIVQARMNSVRLPGKVLRVVGGKPMLAYLLDRLSHLQADVPVVVATSRLPSDDPVADFCRDRGVACVRGELDDVVARFVRVLDETRAEAFVRINGDSPLLDPSLIDRLIELFVETGADLATNVQQRTFPKGMSVEVVDAAVFRRAAARMDDAEDREHVTRFFYRNPAGVQIASLTSGRDLGKVNLCVDTVDDLAMFEGIVARMDRPHWQYGLDDILALMPVRVEAQA